MRNIAKVSVCIPVYGVEKYIEKCARTLFGQTLQEIEYIFVDDCSPDRSVEIMQQVLEEFPHRKEQVKIIRHEINQGVGAARNHAVAACTGEYVIHCDPDDWVELDMYETMYNKAKETDADMVYCSYVHEYPHNKKRYGNVAECNNPTDFLNQMYSGKNEGFLWNKLYKCEIALHKSINCPNDITIHEDMLMNTFMLPLCKKITRVPQRFYHYRSTPFSICNSNSEKDLIKKVNALEKTLDVAKEFGVSIDTIQQSKCMGLLWCVWCGSCGKNYKSFFPDIQCKLKKIRLRIDNKIILIIASYSYSIAFVLYRCRSVLLRFVRFFGKSDHGN